MRIHYPFPPEQQPLIGMVHLLPLPGAPGWGGAMETVVARAVRDAETLAAAGFDGVMVENYLDVPFYPERVPPETVAALTLCVAEVRRAVGIPVGVNVLRCDGESAVAIAAATGARFVRINIHTGVMATDQGLLVGMAHRTVRLRETLRAGVALFADVLVKHATPFPGVEVAQVAEDLYYRGLADALVVTGSGTGKPTDLDRARAVKAAVPEAPLFVGSGVTPETLAATLDVATGVIVGSYACAEGRGGSGIDADRARRLVTAPR